MTAVNISRDWLYRNDEDYTDSVCLLLPKGQATLIDVEHFDWAIQFDWKVLGRSIFYAVTTPVSYLVLPWYGGRKQRKRVAATSTMVSFHREMILQGASGYERHNLSNSLRRKHVDHINRNPWDNRLSNLRVATASQNLHNRAGSLGKSSRFKGVSRSGAKTKVTWVATATVRGRSYHLGTFGDEVDAAMAYNRFVAARCGEFALLNAITLDGDGQAIEDQPTD